MKTQKKEKESLKLFPSEGIKKKVSWALAYFFNYSSCKAGGVNYLKTKEPLKNKYL